ncbi:Inner centromere protein-related protein pic1 [Colletotrichum trifolii]|uniref:Inner centromere protein-related protein pic1 n=1 Tax=Colletotrichum trifolii TaxID=5466 RepID=A0A4R8R0Z0_COLTR|nr:Inner centromere protein-related protein pic1 [Colletotrichum trifolii]
MATMRGTRVPVGSASWIAEERTTALSIVQAEAEEFSFAARNELDWLNEHMAGIFNENEINVAEIFKTPGKLRGKTPRTARKVDIGEPRVPLSDVFSATPKGAPNPFTQQLTLTSMSKIVVAQSSSSSKVNRNISPLKAAPSPRVASKQPVALADSGYYGSQDMDNLDDMDVDLVEEATQIGEPRSSPPKSVAKSVQSELNDDDAENTQPTPTVTRTMRSPEITFQTAKEEQTTRVMRDITEEASIHPSDSSVPGSPIKEVEDLSSPGAAPQSQPTKIASPVKSSPAKRSPVKRAFPASSPAVAASPSPVPTPTAEAQDDVNVHLDEEDDGTQSPSVDSSPIRPVRKSSLNFASLPAREPLKNKSLGPRVSRTSHLDNHRTSYYGRQTGGKSLGNVDVLGTSDDEEDHDDMDIDAAEDTTKEIDNYASTHNKAYTQRLQDQINMLGKSQPHPTRPSKSVSSSTITQQLAQATATQLVPETKGPSSPKKTTAPPTPGAFPLDEEDEDDDWIAPPVPAKDGPILSPRPQLPKSHTADVMEGIDVADTVSGPDFGFPKQSQLFDRLRSPHRAPVAPERTTSAYGHGKSASVSALPDLSKDKIAEELSTAQKHVSVSNPLAAVAEDGRPESPKSPSRSFRDSPLKQVKNKLSSILKTSKGLLASSAAVSAEGKSSLMSPSINRFAFHAESSTESISQSMSTEPLYPDLSKHKSVDTQATALTGSPERPVARRTRASVEKEKEDKRKEKEARHMADQMSKLDRARAEEREKARVFSEEQERIAAMEKQIAEQKEREREREKERERQREMELEKERAKEKEREREREREREKERERERDREREKATRTPAPKEAPRPTRTSPRKAKAQPETEATEHADAEMTEAPALIPPPSASRSAGPGQATRHRELRRPTKPTKEAASRAKQQPTVIRVNTGSQHSQFHPTNSQLSSNLEGTLGSSVKPKSQPSSHSKQASVSSFKSSAGSTGRPKALELAAKRKEQEEKDLQKRKDAKAELERKRAAMQEEERKQEQQRRQEAEKQREAEAKKRQAAIERAKQTRAPPPAARSQPNGPPDYTAGQRSDGQPARPPSRLQSTITRPQEDRPVNAILSNASKAASKRLLPQDSGPEGSARKPTRAGPSYQAKDAKRRRTSDDFADELDMDIQPPNIKGPPVRPPSVGFKKETSTKSMYSTGHGSGPQSASRDLFKGVVTAQHNSTIKATKQLDINQFAKGEIPFNPNPAGPAHKTPARPAGGAAAKTTTIKKSATRSSPRFQDGDKIELPEIDTDPEDEDEADGFVAAWADSPDLRRALMRQENQDPMKIFGQPPPLNMEEVFNTSKERWHKFRARTSSANWNGTDRLTEDEIRKDIAARERLRREGGWSYEMSKDLA